MLRRECLRWNSKRGVLGYRASAARHARTPSAPSSSPIVLPATTRSGSVPLAATLSHECTGGLPLSTGRISNGNIIALSSVGLGLGTFSGTSWGFLDWPFEDLNMNSSTREELSQGI